MMTFIFKIFRSYGNKMQSPTFPFQTLPTTFVTQHAAN